MPPKGKAQLQKRKKGQWGKRAPHKQPEKKKKKPTLRPLGTELSAAARRRAKAVNDSYVANMRDTMRAAIRDADNAEEDMPFRPTEAEQATTHCSSPERRRLQAQGSSSKDAYDLSPTK